MYKKNILFLFQHLLLLKINHTHIMTGRNKKLKPTDNFDEIAANLESCGVAFIDIHNEASFIDNFFTTSRAAMDVMKKGNVNNSEEATNEVEPQKDQKHTIDLGHFTGFHYAGCDENHDKRLSSRYNEYREGFIFSDGELLNVSLNEGGEQNDIKDELYFQKTMEKMFDFLHETVAAQTLRAIERRMDIAEEGSSFANKNWLENNFGPTTSSCQWHVKRYIQLHDERQSASAEENEERENNGSEILPMHTDPSLISVIIHDRPGLNQGGFGLQVLTKVENREANNTEKEKSDSSSMKTIAKPKNNTTWDDVPFHGHHVATILVGSVLSLIT